MNLSESDDAVREEWLRLKHDTKRIDLPSFVRPRTEGEDSFLLRANGDGSFPVTSAPSTLVSKYLDEYAFDTRIDAVDESGTPFVPFVKPLTPREFDLLSYGIMLNSEDHTLLLRDTTEDSISSYADVYLAQLRSVRQSSEAEEAVTFLPGIVPLFRMRFRRGNGDASTSDDAVYLVSVFISGHRFAAVHDDTRTLISNVPAVDYYSRLSEANCDSLNQRQEAWSAWTKYTSGSILADPRDPRCRRQGERTCGYDIAGAGSFEEVDESITPHAPPSSIVASGQDFIPRTCRYPEDRMATRVIVVGRENKFEQWLALNAELGLIVGEEVDPNRAGQVIWKDTRSGVNNYDARAGELSAFLPRDDQVELRTVYASTAEEQLRLWIGNALATAETNNIRQLLIPTDLTMIVGRCTGLHSVAEGETPSSIGARQAAVRVILETVEDWMQKCGRIWRVVIMLDRSSASDPSGWDSLEAANAELRHIRTTKGRLEESQPIDPSPTRNATRVRAARALPHDTVVTLSPARVGMQASSRSNDETLVMNVASVKNDYAISRSHAAGVPVSDQRLHELFTRLDSNKNGWLSKSELKRVFLRHTDIYDDVTITTRGTLAPKRTQDGYLSCGSVLSPLDACGLPFDDAQVEKYLSRFCKNDRMTYPEFACMMLELARR